MAHAAYFCFLGETGSSRLLLDSTQITSDIGSPIVLRCEISLFDHLVSTQQDRLRHRQTERLGGLEVHGHLEFCRKLHREIARLRAAQNAIDISGGATKEVYLVGSVGKQTAVSGKERLRINRRYVGSGRHRYDRRAMRDREWIRDDNKAASG